MPRCPDDIRIQVKSNPTLSRLPDHCLDAICAMAEIVDPEPDTVLYSRGDPAEYSYLLLDGDVVLEAHANQGSDQKLTTGAVFGLPLCPFGVALPHEHSARAIGKVRLLRFAINQTTPGDSGATPSELARLFPAESLETIIKDRRTFQSGSILLGEGEPADDVFILLSGSAQVVRQDGDHLHLLGQIHAGGFFGERGVLQRQPRAASVIAHGDGELLVLDGGAFRDMVARTPGAEHFFTELESVYQRPGRGLVVHGQSAKHGSEAMTSSYSLTDGRNVLMAREIVGGSFAARQVPQPDQIRWITTEGDTDARLAADENGKIIAIEAPKDWPSLETASVMLLEAGTLTPEAETRFVTTGLLERHPTEDGADQILCGCMGLTIADLASHLLAGQTLDGVCRATGAGTGCGSCLTRIGGWMRTSTTNHAHISDIKEDSPGVKRFRISGEESTLPAGQPGQHVILKACINGQPVERSFTMTDYLGGDAGYELTIKYKSGGALTPWLFDQDIGAQVEVSIPVGGFEFADNQRPIVLIAAGIGITPALALVRGKERGHLADRKITILHCVRGSEAPLADAFTNRAEILDYRTWDSSRDGRITEASLRDLFSHRQDSLFWICGPALFEQDMRNHLAACGVSGSKIFIERFTVGNGDALAPGSVPSLPPVCETDTQIECVELSQDIEPHREAELLLRQIWQETGAPDNLLKEQLARVDADTPFAAEATELGYAAKFAWRNSTRCIGRLYWKGLHVHDCRQNRTAEEILDAMEAHLDYGTNGGQIRSTVSIFECLEAGRSCRIINPQLIRYAGYQNSAGEITGDPAHLELTKLAEAHGWRGAGTHFDVLPLMVEDADGALHLRELNPEQVLEVTLSHPAFDWFAELNLRWHALPAISNMCLAAFGNLYPVVMNGWYMGTEIGARNLADNYRYNLLPTIARKLAIYSEDEAKLWKDRALVELNIAVLHSFRQAGVTIVDHHTASREFFEFIGQEHGLGRRAETDWSWIVPPMSGATTPVFHVNFSNKQLKPAFVPYPESP